MPVWPYRFQLSIQDRLRRSVYEVLRDQMDQYLTKYALIESYQNFQLVGEPYPFVSKRELKPRARVVEKEHANQNHFLVLFCEGTIPDTNKKYVRFFESNRVTKEAMGELVHIQMHRNFEKNLRHFDNPGFEGLVLDLLPVDYALLIQRDHTIRSRNRYAMTHFHVRIDWPLDDATENMAQRLRYVHKEIYEKGERYAQHLRHKLFEKYGFHHMVGGRRTAATVAAQYLKRMDFISTVYVASAEARSLTRISERGVTRIVLVSLPIADISRLAETNRLSFDDFVERYLIDIRDHSGVGVLKVVYRNTMFSKPPDDGKLRKLVPDYQWLTVTDQLLEPLADFPEAYPIPYSYIYSPD